MEIHAAAAWKRLADAMAALAAGWDGTLKIHAESDENPFSEASPAAADIEMTIDGVVRVLLDDVGTREVASLDHLQTLGLFARIALAEQVVPVFAPFSIARSAVEAMSLSCWLLEPGLPPVERAGRGLSLGWQEIRNQNNAGADDLEPAKDETFNDATELGLSLVGTGASAGFGHGFPTRTKLVSAVIGTEAYPLLSGASHAETWATMSLGFQAVGEAHLWGNVFVKTPRIESFRLASGWTIRAFSRCVWLDTRYRGWNTAELEALLESVYELADLRDEWKFWR